MFTTLSASLVFNLILSLCNGIPNDTSFRRKEIIGKIVGGVPVDINKFPHSVQVYNMGNMCGGSTLNAFTVLTAAHCFDLNMDEDAIYVIAGARFSFDFNAPLHRVRLVVRHERYNLSRIFECDIALVFLKNPIKFSQYSQKAIIVNTGKWMNVKESNFSVAGWGWTKYQGDISKEGLLMAQMKYIPLATCRRLHKMVFTEDMFCLYGDGVRDTCKGDSGGGVMWKGLIVGLTSHGHGCSLKNSPSVYVNLWYFRSWIHKKIDDFASNHCLELSSKKSTKISKDNDYSIV